jgi:putative FmdB family regulatory protein
MPIFEYVCQQCGNRFETLVRGAEAPACPGCASERLARQLSVFAVGGRGAALAVREPAGPCGSCGDPRGPGSCSLDR